MKTRIEFTATLDVYVDPDDPESWVSGALERGDKHASNYTTWLREITAVTRVGDDE